MLCDVAGVGSRTYILSAESQDDMEGWMKAITCANYEYMKLMVNELQRQMDDLNLEQAAAPKPRPKPPRPRTGPLVMDKARQNPFDAVTDAFGAVPFNAESVSGPQKARTFEEMHAEFGVYINQKIYEELQKTQPLI